ncbi:unnamed protein product [Rotaria sp. Silwood1]|nr:unnamed protein product [Rotaria sp. Silwood1]
MLSRPLMETLRSILYNWKLRETGIVNHRMILNSNFLGSTLCSNCVESKIVNGEQFYIIEYEFNKKEDAKDCLCPFDEEHFLIEHTVKHEFVSQAIDISADQLMNSFFDLLFKCDRLTHFLRQKELLTSKDPFALMLEHFLEEERQICEVSNINHNINKRMLQTLHSIKQKRTENRQKLVGLKEKLSLSQLYELINQLKSIPDVKNQINSIKKSRQLKMQANERRVILPLTRSKIFSEFTDSQRY